MQNLRAAKAVADVVRTTLGPRSMLKMMLDPLGGIVVTNDGNAVLRELDVSSPAAKSMIDLARAQDEEVGDGTTSVIILAGELLTVAEPFLARGMHPTVIVGAFRAALDAALEICDEIAVEIDPSNQEEMRGLVASCVGTKFSSRYGSLVVDLALDAVRKVAVEDGGRMEIDLKRYARVEKIPGGTLDDCVVLNGVMLNKDVVTARMNRRVENPRVVLLDSPLEYKKAESATSLELTSEEDFEAILRQEEEHVKRVCAEVLAVRPTVVVTEKGCSDLAAHILQKAGVTVLRRARKTDNNRIARATGATIRHRTDELTEEDVGTGCGLFEVRKIGDEYFSYFVECTDPKACTILLRGGSKDTLNGLERDLQDALQVAKNVYLSPKLLPGGGALEVSVAAGLAERAKALGGVEQWPFRAVGRALEVIPRTLAQNAGADVVRTLTELRAMKAGGKAPTMGIDGDTGEIVDVTTSGIWDPHVVRTQALKTAVESAALLLRIDDILSGSKSAEARKAGGGGAAAARAQMGGMM